MQRKSQPLSLTKILFSSFAILLCFNCIKGQQIENELNDLSNGQFVNYELLDTNYETEPKESSSERVRNAQNALVALESGQEKTLYKYVEANIGVNVKEKFAYKNSVRHFPDSETFPLAKEKFHWKPALIQSGVFLGIQHGFRVLAQKGTREQLKGPFFRDWAQSVKNLRGWRDGNKFYINYIGHPLQGGLTGRIFVNNSDRAKSKEFGKSKKYWESRFKAMAWSAFWSTQFELGPISESNIGNVGLQPRGRYSSMAYVDLVVTPVLGTGVVIGEDAIDKYILKNWIERKGGNKTKIKILRSVLTPTTTLGNLLRGEVPWKRDNR